MVATPNLSGVFRESSADPGQGSRPMKRLILIFAAIASLSATLPLGELAMADERRGQREARRDDGRRGGERFERGERGGPRGEARGRNIERPRGPPPGQRGDDYERRRYEDRPYPPRSLRQDAPRRGGYLRDDRAPAFVEDYPRYRLRPPPRGYAWVRTGDGYALVGLQDGRVYDVAPY